LHKRRRDILNQVATINHGKPHAYKGQFSGSFKTVDRVDWAVCDAHFFSRRSSEANTRTLNWSWMLTTGARVIESLEQNAVRFLIGVDLAKYASGGEVVICFENKFFPHWGGGMRNIQKVPYSKNHPERTCQGLFREKRHLHQAGNGKKS